MPGNISSRGYEDPTEHRAVFDTVENNKEASDKVDFIKGVPVVSRKFYGQAMIYEEEKQGGKSWRCLTDAETSP